MNLTADERTALDVRDYYYLNHGGEIALLSPTPSCL